MVQKLGEGGGVGSEGRFIPFLCGGEKSDILQNKHLQVESFT